MPRIPKRLLALGGLAAAGGAAVVRRRRAERPATPAPSATPSAAAAPTPPIPPPPDAPGPSVNPVGGPASETERREAAEARVPPPRPGIPADDALVEAEEAAAAAEAAAIGGRRRPTGHDPAMDPVYEAGGGEAEGFELAEADLIENASHGDGRGDPSQDAFTPELEADEVTGIAGEADREHAAEAEDDRS